MEQVRIAEQRDKEDFRRLWRICFGDSDGFCHWFFENRFSPSHSVCLEQDGELRSCMQAFPYTVSIRGRNVKGAMLCGVSTHPNHRKKGYMGKIFSYTMEVLREKGIAVAVHTPAVLESYFSFGHEPVADACYLLAEEIPFYEKKADVFFLEGEKRMRAYPCYSQFASHYSGMIQRTEDDFLRKLDDYEADGGKCLAYGKEEIEAYVCFYSTEAELTCVEAVGAKEALHHVVEGMLAYGRGKSLSVKLPPQMAFELPFGESVLRQKGVMGLCSLPLLLQGLGLESNAAFALTDSVIKANNGCFDLCGKPTEKPPAFSISAGKFLPVLVGYKTLEEQREFAEIYEEAGFLEIGEKLPKVDCYIIDEY